jgi:hypothetical protein
MNYSIRHCAFAISALLIGVSTIGFNTPAQARPKRMGTIDQTTPISAEAALIGEAGGRNEANRRAQQARQNRQRHDNLQAQNLAYAALTQCYTYKNLDACSQLTQIKSTLANWCEQNDRDSCTVYRNVVAFEGLKQTEQTKDVLSEIAGGAG